MLDFDYRMDNSIQWRLTDKDFSSKRNRKHALEHFQERLSSAEAYRAQVMNLKPVDLLTTHAYNLQTIYQGLLQDIERMERYNDIQLPDGLKEQVQHEISRLAVVARIASEMQMQDGDLYRKLIDQVDYKPYMAEVEAKYQDWLESSKPSREKMIREAQQLALNDRLEQGTLPEVGTTNGLRVVIIPDIIRFAERFSESSLRERFPNLCKNRTFSTDNPLREIFPDVYGKVGEKITVEGLSENTTFEELIKLKADFDRDAAKPITIVPASTDTPTVGDPLDEASMSMSEGEEPGDVFSDTESSTDTEADIEAATDLNERLRELDVNLMGHTVNLDALIQQAEADLLLDMSPEYLERVSSLYQAYREDAVAMLRLQSEYDLETNSRFNDLMAEYELFETDIRGRLFLADNISERVTEGVDGLVNWDSLSVPIPDEPQEAVVATDVSNEAQTLSQYKALLSDARLRPVFEALYEDGNIEPMHALHSEVLFAFADLMAAYDLGENTPSEITTLNNDLQRRLDYFKLYIDMHAQLPERDDLRMAAYISYKNGREDEFVSELRKILDDTKPELTAEEQAIVDDMIGPIIATDVAKASETVTPKPSSTEPKEPKKPFPARAWEAIKGFFRKYLSVFDKRHQTISSQVSFCEAQLLSNADQVNSGSGSFFVGSIFNKKEADRQRHRNRGMAKYNAVDRARRRELCNKNSLRINRLEHVAETEFLYRCLLSEFEGTDQYDTCMQNYQNYCSVYAVLLKGGCSEDEYRQVALQHFEYLNDNRQVLGKYSQSTLQDVRQRLFINDPKILQTWLQEALNSDNHIQTYVRLNTILDTLNPLLFTNLSEMDMDARSNMMDSIVRIQNTLSMYNIATNKADFDFQQMMSVNPLEDTTDYHTELIGKLSDVIASEGSDSNVEMIKKLIDIRDHYRIPPTASKAIMLHMGVTLAILNYEEAADKENFNLAKILIDITARQDPSQSASADTSTESVVTDTAVASPSSSSASQVDEAELSLDEVMDRLDEWRIDGDEQSADSVSEDTWASWSTDENSLLQRAVELAPTSPRLSRRLSDVQASFGSRIQAMRQQLTDTSNEEMLAELRELEEQYNQMQAALGATSVSERDSTDELDDFLKDLELEEAPSSTEESTFEKDDIKTAFLNCESPESFAQIAAEIKTIIAEDMSTYKEVVLEASAQTNDSFLEALEQYHVLMARAENIANNLSDPMNDALKDYAQQQLAILKRMLSSDANIESKCNQVGKLNEEVSSGVLKLRVETLDDQPKPTEAPHASTDVEKDPLDELEEMLDEMRRGPRG